MDNSSRERARGLAPARNPPANASRSASFPRNSTSSAAILGNFGDQRNGLWNSLQPQASAISGTACEVKMRDPRIDISQHRCRGDVSMTLTVAHISPIISIIAGVLILIMPRLLNLIVAIFLIVNGLIGLGLLRWLHM
jgi:Protein of unknown function (DUF3096)